ncbi:hypothetical protein FBZ99_101334 [Rhizobium sp. ERR 1071]|uniref:XRE family transcriptional regulator n=1 Tax=Rhizobium sp. ERR 1071 TaxID=2572677 RepID=UPI001199B2A2|nr:XRE family transcriptional regulator [Rhizobium sp. ERR1071]TWB19561.1 hypothetical protein FBZ99_101334 [Rhizobium sp. ERR1071]
MNPMTLLQYRQLAKVTKPVMAMHMGIPLSTYEKIESGQSEFRKIHANAARWALIELAVAYSDASMLPTGIAGLISDAHSLLDNKKGDQ